MNDECLLKHSSITRVCVKVRSCWSFRRDIEVLLWVMKGKLSAFIIRVNNRHPYYQYVWIQCSRCSSWNIPNDSYYVDCMCVDWLQQCHCRRYLHVLSSPRCVIIQGAYVRQLRGLCNMFKMCRMRDCVFLELYRSVAHFYRLQMQICLWNKPLNMNHLF